MQIIIWYNDEIQELFLSKKNEDKIGECYKNVKGYFYLVFFFFDESGKQRTVDSFTIKEYSKSVYKTHRDNQSL